MRSFDLPRLGSRSASRFTGKDAVVIVAADAFEALRARERSASLHELLSQSPLSRMKFGEDGSRSPVREVEW